MQKSLWSKLQQRSKVLPVEHVVPKVRKEVFLTAYLPRTQA